MADCRIPPRFGPLAVVALAVPAVVAFAVPTLVPPASAAAAPGDEAPVGEVRLFEVRRPNSDFTPLEGLRFRLATDGRGVRFSQWLATLARHVPEAYLAQLATFGPLPATDAAGPGPVRRRDGRGIRVHLKRDSGSQAPGRYSVAVTLLRGDEPAHEFRRRDLGIEVGETVFVSGRDFEIPNSVYLSWFREPPDRESRGRLYERLRDHTIFLVVAVTLRQDRGDGGAPRRLRPPDDPRLQDLGPSLVGPSSGRATLRASVAEDGTLGNVEVVETTFPEVMPRVLGIIRDWTFPDAAGTPALLSFPVVAPPRRAPDPGGR